VRRRREDRLRDIERRSYDVCVIGGGATGAACALDAQLRSLRTVLVEAGDFAGATSSKSTKIIHGGVRHLEQAVKELDPGQYHVVDRALHERILMLKNCPYLSRVLEFLIPCFGWMDAGYYDAGLKVYDRIAAETSIFPSHFVSREETLRRMPMLQSADLVGSIAYADGQFEDARYNITLVKTFWESGGDASNYLRVTAFERGQDGKLSKADVEDQLSHRKFVIRSRAFVNATGPFADTIRDLATPGTPGRMRLSKGSHILLPLDVLPGDDALLIPKTEDGRTLFALPWMGRLLVGTTEQEVSVNDELFVTKEEIEFLLRQLNWYLKKPVLPNQVVSGFAGARPLVSRKGNGETKKLSRDDELELDPQSGLISIMGGKWATHRAMAEDTIDAVQTYLRMQVTPTLTRNRPLTGSDGYGPDYWMNLVKEYHISKQTAQHLAERYGTTAPEVLDWSKKDPHLARPIVEGVASIQRRVGLEFFSWRSAIEAAPVTGAILSKRLGWTPEHTRFAVEEYVAKINKCLLVAGFEPEPSGDQKRHRSEWQQ
jgi:glycerol-3-phosphate dehydrogenase